MSSPKEERPASQCHYEVLGVPRDADTTAVKKAHRKLALKLHPDKNHGDDTAADKFRLVQQAYEVLSDSQERKWYDDHRDAILSGWSAGGRGEDSGGEMLFEVVHYMHPGCYSGYHDNDGGFFKVFAKVFDDIIQLERRQTQSSVDLPSNFGYSETTWTQVRAFYQGWESFVSQLNFAWEDVYNTNEDAPNRRIRRLMEEDNKKARRNAKKIYNQDILSLVAFVKRRDPRVKAMQAESMQQKEEQIKKLKEEAVERKLANERAKEAWREQAQRDMEILEEEDQLAGRLRLADLEDDYDYGGGKKRGKRKKNKRNGQDAFQEPEDQKNEPHQSPDGKESIETVVGLDGELEELDEGEGVYNKDSHEEALSQEKAVFDPIPCATDELDTGGLPGVGDEPSVGDALSSHSDESQPEFWRCECCGKDFKSDGQWNNHLKSKKHKEKHKKFMAIIKRKEEELMSEMMGELDL